MKTFKIFVLVLGLVIIYQTKSEAQRFVTSYGVDQSWYLPNEIIHTVEWDYPQYVIAHAHKVYRHGRPYFNLVLQRRNIFLELQFNHFGRVVHRVRYNHFPLKGHICSAYCGYHHTYYRKHAHVRIHHYAHVNKIHVHKKHGQHAHHKSGSNHHNSKVGRYNHNRRDVYHKQSNNSKVSRQKSQGGKVAQGPQQIRTHSRSHVNGRTSASVNRSTNRGSENGTKQGSRTHGRKYTTRGTSANGRN